MLSNANHKRSQYYNKPAANSSSLYVKSRTINFFSRACNLNSSITFLNKVTVNNPYSES